MRRAELVSGHGQIAQGIERGAQDLPIHCDIGLKHNDSLVGQDQVEGLMLEHGVSNIPRAVGA
jgi:hypothetical protein